LKLIWRNISVFSGAIWTAGGSRAATLGSTFRGAVKWIFWIQ